MYIIQDHAENTNLHQGSCNPNPNAAQTINQSIKIHLYGAICRKRMRGACWTWAGLWIAVKI